MNALPVLNLLIHFVFSATVLLTATSAVKDILLMMVLAMTASILLAYTLLLATRMKLLPVFLITLLAMANVLNAILYLVAKKITVVLVDVLNVTLDIILMMDFAIAAVMRSQVAQIVLMFIIVFHAVMIT